MATPLKRLALSSTKFRIPVTERRTFSTAGCLRIAESTTRRAEPRSGMDMDDVQEKDWEFDDISSMAHAELERHRETRHYARVAAYEMPKLSQLAKPFVPPTEKEVLRFRYTTYLGEQHPAEAKVVVEASIADLGLSEDEAQKFVKLAGPRYNPDKGIIRMSCEMFEQQAQNKRYLSDLMDTLLAEARGGDDTFADVPLDFRHHKSKAARPVFPKEWRMTKKRREQLGRAREEREREMEQ